MEYLNGVLILSSADHLYYLCSNSYYNYMYDAGKDGWSEWRGSIGLSSNCQQDNLYFFSLSPLCIFLFQWLTHLIQFISIQYFLVSIILDHKSRMIYIQSVQTKLMLGSTTQIKWQQLKRSINFPFLITRISCISWFPKKLIPLLCETLKLCLHDNEAIPWDAWLQNILLQRWIIKLQQKKLSSGILYPSKPLALRLQFIVHSSRPGISFSALQWLGRVAGQLYVDD